MPCDPMRARPRVLRANADRRPAGRSNSSAVYLPGEDCVRTDRAGHAGRLLVGSKEIRAGRGGTLRWWPSVWLHAAGQHAMSTPSVCQGGMPGWPWACG
eukprot:364126-Chlamydomonas_euryale.AAC.3